MVDQRQNSQHVWSVGAWCMNLENFRIECEEADDGFGRLGVAAVGSLGGRGTKGRGAVDRSTRRKWFPIVKFYNEIGRKKHGNKEYYSLK